MSPEAISLLHEIGPGIGAGIVFSAALCIGASAAGLARTAGGMSWLIAGVVWVLVVCICVSMWAQTHHGQLNTAGLKMVGGIIGVVAGAVVLALIVQRAPETALLAIFCVLVGCGLFGGLVMFAPYHNLLVIGFIILILALAAIIGLAAWFSDRRHERETRAQQNPAVTYYPPQPQQAYLPPREEHRGRLSAPSQKTNLPAVRDDKGRWLT